MNRPKVLHVGGVLHWVMRIRNPDTQVLKDADSTPTVAIRKNGASTGDSVTVTKRSATTGIYDCSYNPAGEVEGDEFTVEETATVTGTTTAQATYSTSWEVTVIAVERGTDGANTTAPANSTIADISSRIPAALDGGRIAAALDPAARVKLDASQPDYAPATPAQVNAQVLDVLAVDTFTEITAPPAATSSLKDKITWLFMYARNKVTQTASQRKVYLDDGTTVAGTSATSDDGTTFTKGEDS